MSEYDDRAPRKPEPGPGQVQDPITRAKDQDMHELWQDLKNRIRQFFVREDKDHRFPPH